MSITINLEPETEAWLQEEATREGRNLEEVVALHLSGVRNATSRFSNTANIEVDLDSAATSLRTRTPQQIAEARERIFAKSRRAKPLPPGKTLEDMVFGKWPGDETDEEINSKLESLS